MVGLETNDPLPECLHCTSAWSPASNICQTSDVEGCAASGTVGLRLTPFEANSKAQLENHFYPRHGRTHRIVFGARAAVCLVALRRCSIIRKHRVIGRVPASRCPPGARVRHGVRAKSDGQPADAKHDTFEAHRFMGGCGCCHCCRCSYVPRVLSSVLHCHRAYLQRRGNPTIRRLQQMLAHASMSYGHHRDRPALHSGADFSAKAQASARGGFRRRERHQSSKDAGAVVLTSPDHFPGGAGF